MRWLRSWWGYYWYPVVLLVAAAGLTVAQVAWHLYFKPSVMLKAVGGVVSLALMLVVAWALLDAGRRARDLRYRWKTRQVSKAMERERRGR